MVPSRHFFHLLLVTTFVLIQGGCKSAQGKYPNDPSKWSRKEKKELIQKVISTARGYMGTPYQWGGITRSGIDCSGLLYTSYKAHGISIPRTSEAQSKWGKKVSKKKVTEGDWVFFAAGKKKRKITHVGLVSVAEGNAKVRFIHASSSLGVVENDLYSDYYQKILIRAVRPF